MHEPVSTNMTLRCSKPRLTLLAAFVICAVYASTLQAGLDYIIFDPSNFTKNLQQVIALIQQVARASEQIRQQEQMLSHLPATVADALAIAGQSLHAQVATTISASTDGVDSHLESRYPLVFPEPEPAWLDIARIAWMQEERTRFLHERNLAQQVQDQMGPTSQRLRTVVEASNGVGAKHWELPGQLATAQAHVELLAICSVEADKLLAIRTARARRNSESHAQSQSESAYQTARRERLMADWNSTGKTKAVPNPF